MVLTTVDISGTFFLSIMFALLLYMWWESEDIRIMSLLTMIIIPYDVVVMIMYALPLYITDVDILAFTQIIFLIISVAVAGYTLDKWNTSIKSRRN